MCADGRTLNIVLLEIMVDFASTRVRSFVSNREEGVPWTTVVREELTPSKFWAFMHEQQWREEMDGPSYNISWLRWQIFYGDMLFGT